MREWIGKCESGWVCVGVGGYVWEWVDVWVLVGTWGSGWVCGGVGGYVGE